MCPKCNWQLTGNFYDFEDIAKKSIYIGFISVVQCSNPRCDFYRRFFGERIV